MLCILITTFFGNPVNFTARSECLTRLTLTLTLVLNHAKTSTFNISKGEELQEV